MSSQDPTSPSWLAPAVSFFSSLLDDLFEPPADIEVRPPAAATKLRVRFPLVAQSDDTGCGVACVAMLAGSTYEDVKRVMFLGSRRKRVFYTGYGDLKRALVHFGITHKAARTSRRFTTWRAILQTSLVAVEQTPPSKHRWHWVVFVDDGKRRFVLDPAWPDIVRTDFRALKGRSYLPLAVAEQGRSASLARARTKTAASDVRHRRLGGRRSKG